MKRVSNSKFSFRKNAIGAVALSSTVLVSSVAAAASLSAAFLWLTTSVSSRGGALVKWRDVVSVLSLAVLSGSKPSWTTVTKPGSTTTTPKPVDSSSGVAGIPATKLGINLSAPSYYDTNRVFANLVAGDVWRFVTAAGQWQDMPTERMNANLEVVDLRPGERIVRSLGKPNKVYRGLAADIICRWQGSAKMEFIGSPVKNLRVSARSLTFTYLPIMDDGVHMVIHDIVPSDPVKNLDCRETDVDQAVLFDKTYLSEIKRYSVIRFMKWTQSVESNEAVTWAARTRPEQAVFRGPQGITLEYMIELANQTGSDPWFAIPWNADDEYVRKFAEMVRDKLNPSLKAYVEVSNEVWNFGYQVSHQAQSEGLARGLSSNGYEALLRRYAQKTGEVMDVWSSVFAGQMHRIVRVAATQHGPGTAEAVLSFGDTAKKVDALATAPYIGAEPMAPGTVTNAASLDQYFRFLEARLPELMTKTRETKAVAKRFGVRYITYEAGQHVTSPNDVPQLARIQSDPRMGNLYTTYLTAWKDQIGDLMVLFSDYGGSSKYGAWGQKDYVGQPLSEAPKENAVELFRQSYVR